MTIKSAIFNLFPTHEFKKGFLREQPGEISGLVDPAYTRLILGGTALISQPFIDLSNKGIDEKTRRVSFARTIAKVIVGTATGFTIRAGCIKAIAKFSQKPGQFFYPGAEKVSENALKQYRSALGTFVALGVMLFTNFLIDAPLTKVLTNYFLDRDGGKHGGK